VRLKQLLAGLTAAALASAATAQDRSSDYGAWFLRTFGPAQPRDAFDRTLLDESNRVFAMVAAVADKKEGRHPRLLVVDRTDGYLAQALPDGTILVNLPLLRFCYGSAEADRGRGRARLAFVLGHEMAHLAYDDSWHAEAFGALRRYGDARLVEETRRWADEPAEVRQSKEFHADQAGFVFVTMAGFDPSAVLGEEADFLKEWAAQVQSDTLPADGPHPPFDQRSRVLQTRLEDMAREVPFFRFGVRLVQLGRFDDAVPLLQHVRATFPSREVENNLGLALYQRALARLAECGSREGLRFKLPLALDPETLAARIHLRGADQSECAQAESARQDLDAAEHAIQSSVDRGPAYAAARVNLAAVLLMDDRPLKALSLLREGDLGESAPKDERLALVDAIAVYLAGPKQRLDTADGALQALEEIESRCQNHRSPCRGKDAALGSAATFNRARILQERGRTESARRAWEAFLEVEPRGSFADEARIALLKAGVEVVIAEPSLRTGARPPLLDRLAPDARRRIQAAPRRPFTLGDIRGAFVDAPGVQALELRGVVELVEEKLASPRAVALLESELGPPSAVSQLESGRETLVYRDAAYDLEADEVVHRVLFQPR
jgi:tetratricopeptide (TPR) repeat protein